MKKPITYVFAFLLMQSVQNALAADDAGSLTLGARLGAAVALCPGFVEDSLDNIVSKTRSNADYQRWKGKNEFDAGWREQTKKEVLDRIRANTSNRFSANTNYGVGTWLFLGTYDFKTKKFPLLAGKEPIGKQVYLHFLDKTTPYMELVNPLGLSSDPPKWLAVGLPTGPADQPAGLVRCTDSDRVCLKVPEDQAKQLADPALNPSRLIWLEMHARLDGCTRKPGDWTGDYAIHASLADIVVHAARRHPQTGIVAKIFGTDSQREVAYANQKAREGYLLSDALGEMGSRAALQVAQEQAVYGDYKVEEAVWQWDHANATSVLAPTKK
jgi:hypothetical protein